MKVAVVIPTHFNTKSSLHVLLGAYRHLVKTKNIEVTIFTDSKNDIHPKDFNIEKIKSIDYKTPLEKALFLFGIPRFYYTDLVEKLKGYEVIETSNPEFYFFACQSYIAARKYNARLVLRTSQTVEGFFLFNVSKYILVPIAKKAYDYASALLFTNPQAAQRCVNLGLAGYSGKFIITGHGVDTKIFRPIKAKKDKNRIVLLSVGGLYKIKGHHIIIESLRKTIDSGINNAELWIVGDGYYKKNLLKLCANLGVQDKVKFLGSLEPKKLAGIYNLSDIFVLANFQEITPAVNEALACGIPVVVMECGGMDFAIPNENYGLVANKFDSDDMSRKILRLIKDKRLAEKIAENGRKYILKNFSLEAYADKLYDGLTRKEK